MNFGEGFISKIYSWVWHPSNDDSTLTDWAAGLVVVLILAFLWSTVIRTIEAS
jgi:hypothetical protein